MRMESLNEHLLLKTNTEPKCIKELVPHTAKFRVPYIYYK